MYTYREEPLTNSQRAHLRDLVHALESGKYAQTRGKLRRATDPQGTEYPIGYCCLGVACDISGLGTWDESRPLSYVPYVIDADEAVDYLPFEVSEYFGLNKTGKFRNEALPGNLSEENDNGTDFSEVARLIRVYILEEPRSGDLPDDVPED